GFHLDNKAPEIEVTMTQGENQSEYVGAWTNETVELSIETIEDNMKTLEIWIDKEKVEDIESFSYQNDFKEDGTYNVKIKATDIAENYSKKEITIKIDKTEPTVTFV